MIKEGKLKNLSQIKDSKKLTPKTREKFYKILTKNPNIKWAVSQVSEKLIFLRQLNWQWKGK